MAAEIPGNGNPDPIRPQGNPLGPEGPNGGSLGPSESSGVPELKLPQHDKQRPFVSSSGVPGQPGAAGMRRQDVPASVDKPQEEEVEEQEVLTPDIIKGRHKAVMTVLGRFVSDVPSDEIERIETRNVLTDLMAVETALDPTYEVPDRHPFSQEALDDGEYNLGLKVATLRTVKAAVRSHLKRQEREGLPRIHETELLEFLDQQEDLATVDMIEKVNNTEKWFYTLDRDPEALAASTERTREELTAKGFVPLEGREIQLSAEEMKAKVFSFTGRSSRTAPRRSFRQVMRGEPRDPDEYVHVLYEGDTEAPEVYARETDEGTEYFVFGGKALTALRTSNIKSLTVRDTDIESIESHLDTHSEEMRFEDSHIGILSMTHGKIVVDNGFIAIANIMSGDAELTTTGTDIVSASAENGGVIRMDEGLTGTLLVNRGGLYHTEGDVLEGFLLRSATRALIEGDATKLVAGDKAHGYVLGKIGQHRVTEKAFITQVNMDNVFVRQITESDSTLAYANETHTESGDVNLIVSAMMTSMLGALSEKNTIPDSVLEKYGELFMRAAIEPGVNIKTYKFDLANYKRLITELGAAKLRAVKAKIDKDQQMVASLTEAESAVSDDHIKPLDDVSPDPNNNI